MERGEAGAYHHTAYLWDPQGGVCGVYRKAHLNREEALWATPGEALCPVWETPLGSLSCMIGDEIWIPEVRHVHHEISIPCGKQTIQPQV